MQIEKSQLSGQRIMPKLGKPRFRHYPFTLGLGFLCLHRRPMIDSIFLTFETEFVLFLAVLENSVLPMGWDSSHETLNMTSIVYKRDLRAVTQNSKWHSVLVVIYAIIGKKNKQTSVSDADRKIPIQCRKLCKPRFQHYPFTLGKSQPSDQRIMTETR